MWEQIPRYLNYVFVTYREILALVLLELLLIGLVVYTVMRFLRGTGGEKLFKGIVFLLIVVWGIGLFARKLNLDLDRIELLSKYFLVAVLVVAAVAFQPELRRGLIRLGVTRFARPALPQMAQVIEQVVDAAAVLSRAQIGALMAFEREVGLGDLAAGGTPIEARVTAQLLNTIFWPGSPLHDMGVIIRQGRIESAGVQFPLAEHGEYDRMLGSRHRAAIGLSNQTDAVVVIVSEETGHIGLAVGGQLTRFLTLEQLRRQLLDLMMPLAAKKSVKPEPKVKAQAESPDKIPKADNRAGAQETVAPDPASMPADQEKSVPKQV